MLAGAFAQAIVVRDLGTAATALEGRAGPVGLAAGGYGSIKRFVAGIAAIEEIITGARCVGRYVNAKRLEAAGQFGPPVRSQGSPFGPPA